VHIKCKKVVVLLWYMPLVYPMRKSIYATTPNLPGVQKSTTLRSIASSVETVDTTKGAFTLVYEPRSRGIEKQSIILIQEENYHQQWILTYIIIT